MAGILKLDQLEEITSDQGIKLSHNLKDPTGNNILTVGSSNASLGSGIDISTPLSTATFPAGHVIQTTRYTYDAANSDTYNNTSVFEIVNKSDVKSWKGTITNVLANNHTHIKMNFCLLAEASSRPDIGYALAIYRESTKIYGGTFNAQNYMYFAGVSHATNQRFTLHNMEFTDTSPAVGTNNYFLGFVSGTSTTISIVSTSPNYVPFECIIQEIAQ